MLFTAVCPVRTTSQARAIPSPIRSPSLKSTQRKTALWNSWSWRSSVRTIIVKDHSRLGRNRLIVGQLLGEEYVCLKIRYIAIMDNIDTAKGISKIVPMQDLFNEWHAENTSDKVRAVFRNKGKSANT